MFHELRLFALAAAAIWAVMAFVLVNTIFNL